MSIRCRSIVFTTNFLNILCSVISRTIAIIAKLLRPYSRCHKKRQIDVSAGWVGSDRTSVTFLRGNYEYFFQIIFSNSLDSCKNNVYPLVVRNDVQTCFAIFFRPKRIGGSGSCRVLRGNNGTILSRLYL